MIDYLSAIFLVTRVKLGNKERFDKEQIGIKEPFPVTNLPFTSFFFSFLFTNRYASISCSSAIDSEGKLYFLHTEFCFSIIMFFLCVLWHVWAFQISKKSGTVRLMGPGEPHFPRPHLFS